VQKINSVANSYNIFLVIDDLKYQTPSPCPPDGGHIIIRPVKDGHIIKIETRGMVRKKVGTAAAVKTQKPRTAHTHIEYGLYYTAILIFLICTLLIHAFNVLLLGNSDCMGFLTQHGI
jgi:hypothetical protein